MYGPAGFSNYNALQVTFVQRNFHGLTLNAGYTFSRDLATPKGGNDPYITNSQCVRCDYGLQTPTQDLGITLVYAVPGIKSPAQLLEGWQISSAINVQSGVPFRALDSGDDFAGVNDNRGLFGGTPEPWSIAGSASNFKLGTFTPVPCYFNDASSISVFFRLWVHALFGRARGRDGVHKRGQRGAGKCRHERGTGDQSLDRIASF